MDVTKPAQDIHLTKNGAASGETVGSNIRVLDGLVNIRCDDRSSVPQTYNAMFKDLLFVPKTNGIVFGLPGDSGSLVKDKTSALPVGMVIAGSEEGGYTLVQPLEPVVRDLGIAEIL